MFTMITDSDMPFKRQWDSSCPKVWDQFEHSGATWVIQDLPPEEDEGAIDMLVDQFLVDEPLCRYSGIIEDPASVEESRDYWRYNIHQRVSLACYRLLDGKRELVALNACPVKHINDPADTKKAPAPWQQVVDGMVYADIKGDPFSVLGVDCYLGGAGLWVRRDIRGAGLGCRLLRAREPLCRFLGLKATVTIFTGPASQKSAVNAGFHVLTSVTFAELADAGLKFPRDENLVMKLMAKKYE